MKIQELFEETADAYILRLTKTLKIKHLGNGYFSHVFQHPTYSNVAVKLIVENDPDYLKYAKFCMRNPNNPYLPNIIDVVKVRMEKETSTLVTDPILGLTLPVKALNEHLTHLVFMEKLRPVSLSAVKKVVRSIVKEIPELQKYERFADFEVEDWGTVYRSTTDKNLKQFAKYAVANRFNDVHEKNIMLDVNGHLVFTDPVASYVAS